MKLFDVYPLLDIEPVKALGSKVWDSQGNEYLDLYGGHAVISIGHSHPHYISTIEKQLRNIGFYSNSVKISLQNTLADKLGEMSGLNNFDLFLTNSGAESTENALKLASFYNGRKKVIAFHKGFHGRTSAAVAVTDNKNIKAPINDDSFVTLLPLNDIDALKSAIDTDTCAVIMEGIQGIGGIYTASQEFTQAVRDLCDATGAIFIHDSVQCGYGRSGKFFTFQYYGITPDIITMAKGMGNGFPVGGVLISPKFTAKHYMLGTTFGGNHLACAAAHAVLDVMKSENLVENAAEVGGFLLEELQKLPNIKEVRGRGLMIGIEMEQSVAAIRNTLISKDHIFTGVAGANIIRLLPSLALNQSDAERFLDIFSKRIKEVA
ncbi:MAG: aspartate aminotransferase family protein [Leadbetterella sp.]